MSGAIPSWAVRGAKVVYANHRGDVGGGEPYDVPDPVLGTVYTIHRVGRAYGEGPAIISLVEINSVSAHHGEIGYELCDFRPLVDDEAQERDVAQFRRLLTQNAPELVE
jgi:hypothetical protein